MSWVQRVTEEGHNYYENPTTGESQWEKPPGYEEDIDALRPPSPPLGAEALVKIPVDSDGDDEPDEDAGSPLHPPPPPPPAVSLTEPTSSHTDLYGDADQGVDFDSPALVTGDIEMGNVAANPMHEKGKLERGDSIKAFGKAVKKEAARAAGKGLGGGVGVKQGVNTEALGKLMEGGGGSLERLTIAINWVQNLGLIMLFEVAWPEVRGCCACVGEEFCWRNSNIWLRRCRVSRSGGSGWRCSAWTSTFLGGWGRTFQLRLGFWCRRGWCGSSMRDCFGRGHISDFGLSLYQVSSQQDSHLQLP